MRSMAGLVAVSTVALSVSSAWAPPPVDSDALGDLVRQQAALLAEAERMAARIDGLVRAVREQAGGATRDTGEVAELLTALDSDEYQTRMRATAGLRRMLVDRLWLLVERPELTPEARSRVKSILDEASAMIGLTHVAVDLTSAQRDALWTLLDDEPDWVLAALGDDAEGIRHALRNPPADHARAVEIVLAAIVRNGMRPVARQIAVSEIHHASSGLLREAMLDLLEPPDLEGADPVARTFANYREQAAVQAVRTLARRPAADLIARILATLDSATRWNVRYELFLVETLVNVGATEAVGPLFEIAVDKRARLNGHYKSNGLQLQPGDCELIAAALLLGLDLDALEVIEREPRNFNEPHYRGFEEPTEVSPEREAAYDAVQRAVEAAGPHPPLPEYERLRVTPRPN